MYVIVLLYVIDGYYKHVKQSLGQSCLMIVYCAGLYFLSSQRLQCLQFILVHGKTNSLTQELCNNGEHVNSFTIVEVLLIIIIERVVKACRDL